MAKGALRGAAGAWMGLIVLQAITTKRGADTVGGLFGTVQSLVTRALDPKVPAIPDHGRNTTDPPNTDPNNVPEPVLPPGQGRTPGDSSPRLNSDGKLITGDPNGVPGGQYDGGIHPQLMNYVPWPSVPGSTTYV